MGRVAAALAAGALAATVLAGPAEPAAGGPPDPAVTATVFADQPTTPEYRVTNGYTAVSTGGAVTVRRTGTGAYTVILDGAGTRGGVAHVVAYGGGPVHCTLAGWFPTLLDGEDQLILVRCFAATGAPVDSRFVATFTAARSIHQGRLAWFVTDQAAPEIGLRTLTGPYTYDSTGGTVAYRRLSTGVYEFDMNDNPPSEYEGPYFPMVHVTAVATTAVNCQIDAADRWNVRCANAAGRPTDARFAVTYGMRVDLLGQSAGPRFASGTLYGEEIDEGGIWGDSYNSTLPGYGGTSGTLLGTGRYAWAAHDTGAAFGAAFVNAHLPEIRGYSQPQGHCVLASWSRSGVTDTVVRVNCYAWLGVPANLNARISYTTWPAP